MCNENKEDVIKVSDFDWLRSDYSCAVIVGKVSYPSVVQLLGKQSELIGNIRFQIIGKRIVELLWKCCKLKSFWTINF
jgi:hypothetical protein